MTSDLFQRSDISKHQFISLNKILKLLNHTSNFQNLWNRNEPKKVSKGLEINLPLTDEY